MTTVIIPSNGGETAAQELGEVFREHGQFVYRTAYSVTGNRPDAEDVLQNIFAKLLAREISPGLKKNPRAYLYRSAINLSLNIVRSRRSQNLAGDIDLQELPALATESSDDDPLHRHLLEAMAQLNPATVEILILRYTHNCSDAEIARMLGKSRGTIAVTLYRARTRLKKLLRAAQKRESTHETH
jgi:RNA polymerase sigma-70 factor (ECF subfamily)